MYVPLQKRYYGSSYNSCNTQACQVIAVIGVAISLIFLFIGCAIICSRTRKAKNRLRRAEAVPRNSSTCLRYIPHRRENCTEESYDPKAPPAYPAAAIPSTVTERQRKRLQRRERNAGASISATTGQLEPPHLTIEVLPSRDAHVQAQPPHLSVEFLPTRDVRAQKASFPDIQHPLPAYTGGNDTIREPPPAYRSPI